jgi:HK97 family phage prohead protease
MIDAARGSGYILARDKATLRTPSASCATQGRRAEPTTGQPIDAAFPCGGDMLHKLDITDLRLSPAAALEVKFSDAKAGAVHGLASVFDTAPDAYGDTVAPGAFAASLKAHEAAGTRPAFLWQHNPAEPIGVWEGVAETASALEVRGRLNLDTQRGREAAALLKQGALRGLSIGYRVSKSERTATGGRRLTQVDLIEVSLVTFAAQPAARVIEAKSIATARDYETALRALGFPRAAATKLAAGGWAALAKSSETETEAKAELVAAIRATAAAFTKGT